MRRSESGFTLIEIAIVLVIVGLLLGGVLKGQELITGAKVRNLIAQQDSIKAAFYAFQDRYRAIPGDYAAASANINCSGGCANGNGNGRIENGAGGGAHEEILAWSHLAGAGFLTGSYTAAAAVSAPAEDNTPKNPYGAFIEITFDGIYGAGSAATPAAAKHNLKTGNQVPVEIMAEIDRKIDDGKPHSGAFQFSLYGSGGSGGPTAANCLDAAAPPNWKIAGSETNCGGASVF